MLHTWATAHHTQKCPIKNITTKKAQDPMTPRRTIKENLWRSDARHNHTPKSAPNQATPIKETGHPRPGTLPHGPFAIALHPLSTPQPGAWEYKPSLVPASTSEPAIAPNKKSTPVIVVTPLRTTAAFSLIVFFVFIITFALELLFLIPVTHP
jgi:hypothetical protein